MADQTTPVLKILRGNVGIGTASPSRELEVQGSGNVFARITASTDSDSAALELNNNGNELWTLKADDTAADYFKITNNAGTALTIDTSRNVGIGTTSPASLLHIDTGANSAANFRLGANRTSANAAVGQLIGDWNGTVVAKIALKTGDDTTNKDDGEIAFEVAAAGTTAEAMRIQNDGNVGIGTTSPDYELEVSTSSNSRIAATSVTNSVVNHLQADSSGGYVGPLSNHSLFIKTNNTTRWTVNTSGNLIGSGGQILYGDGDVLFPGSSANFSWDKSESELLLQDGAKVGIGVDPSNYYSAANKLVVGSTSGNQGLTIVSAADSEGAIYWADGTSGNQQYRGYAVYQHATDSLVWGTSGATRLTIDSSGKVGIGTTSPVAKFEVTDGSSSITLQEFSNGAAIFLDGVNGDFSGGDYFHIIADGNSYLGLGGYGAAATPLNVANTGKVGIGTTSPGYKLDVTSSSNTTFRTATTGTDRAEVAILKNSGTAQQWTLSVAGTTNGYSVADKYFYIADTTGGTTPLVIDKSGNVGIGTTSPNAKLEISGDTRSGGRILYGGTESNYLTGVSYASIYGTEDTFESVSGLFGSLVLQSRSNTDRPIIFVTGATPSEKMRLSSSGSLGIGTTSPAAKLEIVNSANSAFLVNTGAGTGYTYLKSTNTGGEFLLGINRSDGVLFSSGLAYATSLGTTGSTALQFHTNNNPRVTVDTSGNVGIGTTSPARKLDLTAAGQITFGDGVTGDYNQGIYWNSSDGYGIYKTSGSWSSPNYQQLHIRFVTGIKLDPGSGTYGKSYVGVVGGMSIGDIYCDTKYDNGLIVQGNVGVGTASPTTTLHLSHPAVGQSGSAVTSLTKAQALDLGLKLSFSGGANSDGNILGGIALGHAGEEYAGLYAIDGGSSAATDLAFFVGDTNGINEAVHIDSGGTVQINSPSAAGTRSLTVKLTDNTSGAAVFEQSSNEYLRINTTNGSEKIILGDNGTNPKINFNGEYDFPTADGSAGQVLTTDGSGTLSFSSAGSGTISGSGTDNYVPRFNGTTALENSVIYDDGTNIGIGTTSPSSLLNLNDASNNLSHQIGFSYVNGGTKTDTFTIGRNSSTGNLEFHSDINNHGFEFKHNAAGTQEFNILNMNVGIGTASPGAKLDIHSGTNTNAIFIREDTDDSITHNLYIDGSDNGVVVLYANGQVSKISLNTAGDSYFNGGSVGIGTTSPAVKLDVAGNIKHEGLTMSSGTDIDQLATSSQSLTITTDWQDTGVAGSSLATGTYIVQLYANDYSVGGGQYSVYYSGTMSWYGSGTNDTDFNSEIVLHRAGHADNDKYLYLRTVTHASGTLSLEIAGNYTATGASTYTFKFRRMI